MGAPICIHSGLGGGVWISSDSWIGVSPNLKSSRSPWEKRVVVQIKRKNKRANFIGENFISCPF
jgi:hypothetical protein